MKFNKKARANTPKAKAKRLLDHVNTPAKLVKPKNSRLYFWISFEIFGIVNWCSWAWKIKQHNNLSDPNMP